MIKDIQINNVAFEQLGWRPEIDEDLLIQLLTEQTCDVKVPDEKHLTLKFEPHPNQNDRLFGKGASHVNGNYVRKQNTANVYLRPDRKSSNGTILHETRHWVQDVTNMYPRFGTVSGRFIETVKGVGRMPKAAIGCCLGSAATGYAGYEITDSGPVGVIIGYGFATIGGIMLLNESLSRHTPWERDAYRFADDPLVQERYGNILTYQY